MDHAEKLLGAISGPLDTGFKIDRARPAPKPVREQNVFSFQTRLQETLRRLSMIEDDIGRAADSLTGSVPSEVGDAYGDATKLERMPPITILLDRLESQLSRIENTLNRL